MLKTSANRSKGREPSFDRTAGSGIEPVLLRADLGEHAGEGGFSLTCIGIGRNVG